MRNLRGRTWLERIPTRPLDSFKSSSLKTGAGWRCTSILWPGSDQLLEAMFTFSRMDSDTGPLNMYLTFAELDSHRPAERRLKADTLRVLAKNFDQLSEQYLLFSEFPELDDASIIAFVNTADTLD